MKVIAWSVQTGLYTGIVVSGIAAAAYVNATSVHCTCLLSVQLLLDISLVVHPCLCILVDIQLMDQSP